MSRISLHKLIKKSRTRISPLQSFTFGRCLVRVPIELLLTSARNSFTSPKSYLKSKKEERLLYKSWHQAPPSRSISILLMLFSSQSCQELPWARLSVMLYLDIKVLVENSFLLCLTLRMSRRWFNNNIQEQVLLPTCKYHILRVK